MSKVSLSDPATTNSNMVALTTESAPSGDEQYPHVDMPVNSNPTSLVHDDNERDARVISMEGSTESSSTRFPHPPVTKADVTFHVMLQAGNEERVLSFSISDVPMVYGISNPRTVE